MNMLPPWVAEFLTQCEKAGICIREQAEALQAARHVLFYDTMLARVALEASNLEETVKLVRKHARLGILDCSNVQEALPKVLQALTHEVCMLEGRRPLDEFAQTEKWFKARDGITLWGRKVLLEIPVPSPKVQRWLKGESDNA